MKPLTKAEEQVMQQVWKLSSAYLKDIVESYPMPRPHTNTVATLVKILVDKGYIGVEAMGRVHRYFPDLIILYKHKDGTIRKEIVEVKPYKETVPTPKMSERDKQVLAVNMAKWQAASEFANMHGAVFRVVTEKSLFSGTRKRKAPEVGRAV